MIRNNSENTIASQKVRSDNYRNPFIDIDSHDRSMDPLTSLEEVEELSSFVDRDGPISQDRSNQLAVECWNLRKTILELNSQMIKYKNDNKTHRNLVKNLQGILSNSQSENQVRGKENSQLKSKLRDLEKSFTDLNNNFTAVTNTNIKQKRLITSLQSRLHESEKMAALKSSSSEELIVLLRQQLKEKEELFEQRISEKDAVLKDLQQQNVSLNTVVNHGNMKIEELLKENDQLKQQVSLLQTKCDSNEASFLRELEKTYDELHSKLEQLTSEKQEFYRRYIEKEHQLTQLRSFILSEGLQPPSVQDLDVI